MPPSPQGSRRREREREELRRQIIAAARHLFVTEGYESTTVRRIAQAVEYTPGAIYSYFKDKDEILYAIHQEGFQQLQLRFASALTHAQTPLDQLRALGEAYLAFGRENPELYHLMFLAQATSRTLSEAESWPEGLAVYDSLRALVRHAVEDGWIRPGDPEVIAFTLWSAAHGATTLDICNRCMVLPEGYSGSIVPLAYQYLIDALAVPAAERAKEEPKPEAKKKRSLPEQ